MWIKIEDGLPIQNVSIRVKNGGKIWEARYYRKKWRSIYGKQLHKVTEWYKCPVEYPKIPAKDMKKFVERYNLYKHQMQKRNFVTRYVCLNTSNETTL